MRHEHPIRQLLTAAAMGAFPDDNELDELELDDDIIEDIRDAAARIVAIRASGNRGAARREATEAAHDIGDRIPAGWRPPALDRTPAQLAADVYHDGHPDDLPDNHPRRLAAHVPRR
jgi:hypothetical protein